MPEKPVNIFRIWRLMLFAGQKNHRRICILHQSDRGACQRCQRKRRVCLSSNSMAQHQRDAQQDCSRVWKCRPCGFMGDHHQKPAAIGREHWRMVGLGSRLGLRIYWKHKQGYVFKSVTITPVRTFFEIINKLQSLSFLLHFSALERQYIWKVLFLWTRRDGNHARRWLSAFWAGIQQMFSRR